MRKRPEGWNECVERFQELVAEAPRTFTHAIVTKATWSVGDRSGVCGAIELHTEQDEASFPPDPATLPTEAKYPRAHFRRWRINGPDLANAIVDCIHKECAEPLYPHWERLTHRYETPRPTWPRHELRFTVDPQSLDTSLSEPLLAMGLPPHPSLRAALAGWFPRRDPAAGTWTVFLPDERGCLSRAQFRGDGRVEIEIGGHSPTEGLEVHVVLRSAHREGVYQERIPVRDGHASFLAPAEASSGDAYLLGPDNEILDAHFMDRAAREPPAIEAQTLLDRCVADLLNGEDEHVEIKPWVGAADAKETEFLVAMIAFANTDGGRLYIGANDDGVPQGRGELLKRFAGHGDGAEGVAAQRIEKIALERLLRPPPFKVHQLSLDGVPLLCVEVEAGPDRPYATKHNDIYVRRRASNRRPEAHLVSLSRSRTTE